jgi:hypothetical protein
MATKDQFRRVFDRLRHILTPYRAALVVVHDSENELYLDTHHVMKNGRPLYFGSTIIKKNYVSFYLMPVYLHPEMLDGISDALRKRMQGKSCFNFKEPNEELFTELEELTRRGFARYQADGFVG